MNRSESISKIAVALLKAQSSMGNAVKGAANPFFKSKFADLNSVREAVTPALNANGIAVLQPTTTLDGKAFVETTLLHESGEFISSLTEIVTAKSNDPQAAGSGISYARRYGLQSFLSVGAEDDDGEAAMGRGRSVGSTSVSTRKTGEVALTATSENIKNNNSAVGITGDISLTGTSAIPETVTVVTPVANKSATKKVPFNKPGVKPTTTSVVATAQTENGNNGAGGWA